MSWWDLEIEPTERASFWAPWVMSAMCGFFMFAAALKIGGWL